MENLNAEQIKKALECCKTPLASDCENCSYAGKRLEDGVYEGCVNCLVGDALSLINSQEQMIKELAENNEYLKMQVTATEAMTSDYREDNKRIKKDNEYLRTALSDTLQKYRNERADTVRKMQKEINKTLSVLCKGDASDVRRMIDQIAKEMLEEK